MNRISLLNLNIVYKLNIVTKLELLHWIYSFYSWIDYPSSTWIGSFVLMTIIRNWKKEMLPWFLALTKEKMGSFDCSPMLSLLIIPFQISYPDFGSLLFCFDFGIGRIYIQRFILHPVPKPNEESSYIQYQIGTHSVLNTKQGFIQYSISNVCIFD